MSSVIVRLYRIMNIMIFNIISLFLIVCNECFCEICKTCICTTSNAGPIVNCHDRHDKILNFDLFTLDQHRSLNKLILSKNNIVLLPMNELKNLKLKKLDLSQNQLDNLHSDVFRNLNDLEDLDYSYNLLWNFDISTLNIISTLSKLNLSHNQINNLEKNSANVTTKLKVLDVSHNNFTSLNFFDGLPELEYLDLSFNKLATIPINSLVHLQHLKILHINDNYLLFLNLKDLPVSLLELNARGNLIRTLSFQKSSIRTLNVQSNHISNIYKNLTLLGGLKNLNISGNSLLDFPDVFLKNLEMLDLSFNNLTTIPETVSIKNFPSLRIFKINGNCLKDIKIRSELKLEKFEVNFVSTFEEIDKDTFLMLREKTDGCINVTVSNNMKLSTIQKNVFQHMNICSLDLSNNRFAHLPSELFHTNVYNRNNSIAKYLINLQGNPFICNCSLQWMLNELIPHLYTAKPNLLEDLRCAGPPPLINKRMIHWYKWKEEVFCNDMSHYAEDMTVNIASISSKQIVTFETSPGMIAVLTVTVILFALLTITGILLTQRMIAKRRRVNRRF